MYCPPSPCAPERESSNPEPRARWRRESRSARSFTWRGKHSPPSTWRKRWQKVDWLKRTSGPQSKALIRSHSKRFAQWLDDLLSSLPLVSLASHTQQPASVNTSTTADGSGQRLTVGFAVFDRASSSWKTSQGSLFADLSASQRPWPKRGILLHGTAFELPKRELRTVASGSSWSEFYPTPSAVSYGSSQNEGQVPHDRPSRGTPSLKTWAKSWHWATRANWATPTGSSHKGTGRQGIETRQSWLPMQAEHEFFRAWATPVAADSKGGLPKHTKGGRSLRADQMEFFHRFLPDLATGMDGQLSSKPNDGISSQPSQNRKLNPRFVAWLMGWLTETELTVCD